MVLICFLATDLSDSPVIRTIALLFSSRCYKRLHTPLRKCKHPLQFPHTSWLKAIFRRHARAEQCLHMRRFIALCLPD